MSCAIRIESATKSNVSKPDLNTTYNFLMDVVYPEQNCETKLYYWCVCGTGGGRSGGGSCFMWFVRQNIEKCKS